MLQVKTITGMASDATDKKVNEEISRLVKTIGTNNAKTIQVQTSSAYHPGVNGQHIGVWITYIITYKIGQD
jgi:hypothetical protein